MPSDHKGTLADRLYSKSLPQKIPWGRLCKKQLMLCYGEGEALEVEVEDDEDEEEPLLGDEAVLMVVLVSVLLVPAGDGFTTVVLFSDFAGGLVVSVFCSQAPSKAAAPARMQMYFFICCRWEAQCGLTQESSQLTFSDLRVLNSHRVAEQRASLEFVRKWKSVCLGDRPDGKFSVERVDTAAKRRLFLASTFEPEIGE